MFKRAYSYKNPLWIPSSRESKDGINVGYIFEKEYYQNLMFARKALFVWVFLLSVLAVDCTFCLTIIPVFRLLQSSIFV